MTAAPGVRKVVTVLFTDVVGSTGLGEELDPESLRHLMSRYFEDMRAVIERHGGTTEKFIGDAIMAVFGIPQVHEDDAVRAVRAAIDMRRALTALNETFERTWGVTIDTRTGINTGEVMADSSPGHSSFVSGDAVNVAARLEQAAEPGEILLGGATYGLVRDAVNAELVGSLAVRGKTGSVTGWRLLDVDPAAPGLARRLNSPLVGRTSQLQLLRDAFSRAVDRGGIELVTVVAAAGLGKSRLANEFLSTLEGRARPLVGACTPYGSISSLAPVVAMVKAAAEVTDDDSPEQALHKVAQLLEGHEDGELVVERVSSLLGAAGPPSGMHETFWALRKLFEDLARSTPLVLVFDDVHWADPTLLDLVEYLVDWMQGHPVLVVCLARPDLLEARAWTGTRPNATVFALPPLSDEESRVLIDHVLEGAVLPEPAANRIVRLSEGNPLFVEETLRMLADEGKLKHDNGQVTVEGDLSALSIPPTINALLTARLDRLENQERAVIDRASVVGRTFWWGAVCRLASDEPVSRIGGHLQSLLRKELIRSDQTVLRGEDAFRFAHLLLHDAAYRSIPKSVRATLHEQFADWLETTRDVTGGYGELLGHHLEQAYKLRGEMGPADERVQTLGARAAAALTAAGRKAYALGDMPAAVDLLSRAASLPEADEGSRVELLSDLAFALLETGDFPGFAEAMGQTAALASASDDELAKARASLLGLWARLFTDPEGWAEEARREADSAVRVFSTHGDERGLARAWALLALFHVMKCTFSSSEDAWEKAVDHALAAGDRRAALENLAWIPITVLAGPKPVDECLRVCRAVEERAAGDRKATSTAQAIEGMLEAMAGRFDQGRRLADAARTTLAEVALPVWAGALTQMYGWVELLAGDPAAAERHLRAGVDTLRDVGEASWLSTTAAILGVALEAQGRDGEAEEALREAETAGASDDAYSQALVRSVRAKVLARQGRLDEAERQARDGVHLAATTDFLFLQALCLLALGQVLQAAGKAVEAEAALRDAAVVAERKGFVAAAQQARELLSAPRL